jgi:hypothetical protein
LKRAFIHVFVVFMTLFGFCRESFADDIEALAAERETLLSMASQIFFAMPHHPLSELMYSAACTHCEKQTLANMLLPRPAPYIIEQIKSYKPKNEEEKRLLTGRENRLRVHMLVQQLYSGYYLGAINAMKRFAPENESDFCKDAIAKSAELLDKKTKREKQE